MSNGAPASDPAAAVDEAHDRRPSWRAAFTHRGFNAFQTARLLSIVGTQMQSVAIGWQIYAITRRPIDLAWVGLAQFLPAVCLSLVTGQAADRFPRHRILMVCYAAMAVLSAALFAIALCAGAHVTLIYLVLAGVGIARAFQMPANQSILPSLVPIEHFANAVAWGSSFWQVGSVLGPAAGGFIYAAWGGAAPVYAIAAVFSVGAFASTSILGSFAKPRPVRAVTRSSLFAGVRYVWNNPIVLGATSLDLFAVLLGGATALLPVYARDILDLGPWALGILRSAPAAGAAAVAVILALFPIERHAGAKMLLCVAFFGVGTIVFGLSRHFFLSLTALLLVGASDMVSVFVRSSLVQLATPDAMRGRVSAVNAVFIGASNELGEFESGVAAQWLGTVPSVVLGGIGTLVVVLVWAWRFPELRRVDRLMEAEASAKRI